MPDRIEALKELAQRATPGPFEVAHAGSAKRGHPFQIDEYFVRRPGDDFAIAADIVDADMKPIRASSPACRRFEPKPALQPGERQKP